MGFARQFVVVHEETFELVQKRPAEIANASHLSKGHAVCFDGQHAVVPRRLAPALIVFGALSRRNQAGVEGLLAEVLFENESAFFDDARNAFAVFAARAGRATRRPARVARRGPRFLTDDW
jgi:hypothetical protein